MTQLSLSARDQRAVVIGLARLVVLAGAATLYRAHAWQSAQLQLLTSVSQLDDRALLVPANRASLRDSTLARRSRLAALDTSLIAGVTVDAAATRLADRVGDVARATGVMVGSMQLQPSHKPIDRHVVIAVRLTATANIATLTEFLRAIDTHPAHLVVDELSIAGSAAPATDALRCEVTVRTVAALRTPTRAQ